ncbi:TapB family protein [Pseudotamlana agarivorans]|uniref:TapB family protein n=1 Tax=Pseudotamlana agarivorans TaxID=481183 RepID=UPI000831005B|nr:hypothetical protein [Tamlana agarivorans]
MKSIFKKLSTTLLFFGVLTSTTVINAQSCSDYYPTKKGTKYEITHYDKKNKLASKDAYEIIGTSGNTTTIHVIMTDEKGKETINDSYDMICTGDAVEIDVNSMISKKMASELAGKDIDLDINGTKMVIPNNLSVGKTLPDNNLEMDIKAGSMDMKFKVKTYNRKVTGKEKVTVPAGTFDCFVLEQETEMHMLITKHTKSKQWIAEGVGLVKQETYNKKGKFQGKEELTAFSK